jgi:hypothetical protein
MWKIVIFFHVFGGLAKCHNDRKRGELMMENVIREVNYNNPEIINSPYKSEKVRYTPPKNLPGDLETELPTSLKWYVVEFQADALRYGIDVSEGIARLTSVEYGNTRGDGHHSRVGLCESWEYHKGSLAFGNIKVEQPSSFDLKFKALMYHELSHCILRRSHTSQNERTIMSPTLHEVDYYEACWDGMLATLFTGEPLNCG